MLSKRFFSLKPKIILCTGCIHLKSGTCLKYPISEKDLIYSKIDDIRKDESKCGKYGVHFRFDIKRIEFIIRNFDRAAISCIISIPVFLMNEFIKSEFYLKLSIASFFFSFVYGITFFILRSIYEPLETRRVIKIELKNRLSHEIIDILLKDSLALTKEGYDYTYGDELEINDLRYLVLEDKILKLPKFFP